MKKKIFCFLLLTISFVSQAQNLFFSFPYQISDPINGNTRPRVALINNLPLVVWGDQLNNDVLKYAHWNGNGFDTPIQLTHNDESVVLGYAEGPVIKTFGDTVYICYFSMDMINSESGIYLRKSTDGGLNFSDTILVNDPIYGDMMEYANMTLDENGNPYILFIRSESGDRPKNVLYHSTDGGNTFTGEINITPDTSMQPCECCPASIQMDNNLIYCTYRNNIDNIRDFYVSISENSGMSFDSLRRIDNTNWFSNSCPASGASSMLSGDSLINVYMVKENNRSMIKATAMHKTTYEPGPEYYVDPQVITASYQMNYPEIAGNGDTIGIVWQDNRTGYNKVYISYSTTGLSNLSAPLLISDFTGNVHQSPHLVFENGIFHLTWKDYNNDIVWYRKASFDSNILSNNDNNASEIILFPNPANHEFLITTNENKRFQLQILDLTGKLIYSAFIQGSEKINTEEIIPGVYQIVLSNDSEYHSEKLLIQR